MADAKKPTRRELEAFVRDVAGAIVRVDAKKPTRRELEAFVRDVAGAIVRVDAQAVPYSADRWREIKAAARALEARL